MCPCDGSVLAVGGGDDNENVVREGSASGRVSRGSY